MFPFPTGLFQVPCQFPGFRSGCSSLSFPEVPVSHLSTWQVETEMKMVTPKVQNQQKVGVLETWMVATQICFIFNPICGEMIQFDEHIFQMGWFNHQLETSLVFTRSH